MFCKGERMEETGSNEAASKVIDQEAIAGLLETSKKRAR